MCSREMSAPTWVRRIQWIADTHGHRACLQSLDERALDAPMNEHARAVRADLARRVEIAEQRPPTAFSRCASSKTMSGDLPPSSRVTCLSVRAASAITALPVPTSPGEGDLANSRMPREQSAGVGVALDDLEHPGWQARLGEDLLRASSR